MLTTPWAASSERMKSIFPAGALSASMSRAMLLVCAAVMLLRGCWRGFQIQSRRTRRRIRLAGQRGRSSHPFEIHPRFDFPGFHGAFQSEAIQWKCRPFHRIRGDAFGTRGSSCHGLNARKGSHRMIDHSGPSGCQPSTALLSDDHIWIRSRKFFKASPRCSPCRRNWRSPGWG